MQNNKIDISIVSSIDALTLAKSLKENLTAVISEARIWIEGSDQGVSPTVKKMLDNVTEKYDFTLIILTRKDLFSKEIPEQKRQRARDNCLFMAGLSMGAATLGQNRCFLVSSIRKSDLPVDLHGINFLYFNEPDDLANDDLCKQTLVEASNEIMRLIKERGGIIRQESPHFLSFMEILEKERIEGGDLKKPDQVKNEDSVVVACDALPIEGFSWATQIKENLDNGIKYFYFYYAKPDVARRICRLLQMILLADFLKNNSCKGESFQDCLEKIKENKDTIINNLKHICKVDSLNIYFTPIEPAFNFRIHNAGNSDANIYLRYGNSFVNWSGSGNAMSVYEWLRRYEDPKQKEVLFCSNKYYDLNNLKKDDVKLFRDSLNREITIHFPEIDVEVKKLCYGKGLNN